MRSARTDQPSARAARPGPGGSTGSWPRGGRSRRELSDLGHAVGSAGLAQCPETLEEPKEDDPPMRGREQVRAWARATTGTEPQLLVHVVLAVPKIDVVAPGTAWRDVAF